jgi:hypothetical protein
MTNAKFASTFAGSYYSDILLLLFLTSARFPSEGDMTAETEFEPG